MLRRVVQSFKPRVFLQSNMRSITTAPVMREDNRYMTETQEEEADRFVKLFSQPDIDHWWLTKHINELTVTDSVPDPKACIACLEACRKLNDIAIAVRFLEVIRFKCGPRINEIMPYMMQEIGPTLKKLGIPTLEDLGYLEPELALEKDTI